VIGVADMVMTLLASGSVALTVMHTIWAGREGKGVCVCGGGDYCTCTVLAPDMGTGSGPSALPAVDTNDIIINNCKVSR